MYLNRYTMPVADTNPTTAVLTVELGRETMSQPKAESAPPERIQPSRHTARQKGSSDNEEQSVRSDRSGGYAGKFSSADLGVRAAEHLAGRHGQGRGKEAVHELLGTCT